jgi:mRNA interferase MazF
MRQREIWEVFFDPVLGSEQSGRRPAVVISGNMVNKNINTIIVCPLTSSLKNDEGNLILKSTDRNILQQISKVIKGVKDEKTKYIY